MYQNLPEYCKYSFKWSPYIQLNVYTCLSLTCGKVCPTNGVCAVILAKYQHTAKHMKSKTRLPFLAGEPLGGCPTFCLSDLAKALEPIIKTGLGKKATCRSSVF